MQTLTRLIESFPTVYGLWSSIEIEMLIPLGAHALKTVNLNSFKCRNFLALLPVLLKLHILTRLIESFPTVYGLWSSIEIEMYIPLGAHA